MNRPGQSFPGGLRLTINTGDAGEDDTPFTVDFSTPTENKFPPAPPSHLFPAASLPNNTKALNESRKLLAHLLGQLQSRTLPPPIFDTFKDLSGLSNDKRLADVVKSVRAAVRLTGGKRDMRVQPSVSQRDDSDEEDESEQGFTTDSTFSLMSQLKDVLLISRAQNWQIFHDNAPSGGIEDRHDPGRSPFRRRRSSLQPGGNRRTHSASPGPHSHFRAPALLSQCISLLASIVLEDCRYKISSPRPSRPPNSLQAVVLDIAQFLIHTQRHDSKVISQIAFALMPAFSTFHIEMQPRLLAFFEEGIIRGVLQDLNLTQGASPVEPVFPRDKLTAEVTELPPVSIQIEGPEDDDSEVISRIAPPWTPWSSLGASDTNVESTKAPFRPLPVYYLASIIPPLLVAILENIDLNSPSPSTLHRFCQLVNLIATSKPDAYLDVLEVIAYHTTKARRSALCLLATFWPNAVGHVTISKPLPVFSYDGSLQLSGGTGSMLRNHLDHPYAHQFVPWRFTRSSSPPLFEGMLQQACGSCSNAIYGFGLLCPFCMCAVHFDCYDYPEGSFLSQYALASDPNTQKVAVHRFCHVLSPRRDWDPQVIIKERHAFRAVNIFTLSLCSICRRPLWGCFMQGLKCSSCEQFVHSSCLSQALSTDLPRCRSVRIDSSHMTITSDLLRVSFLDHYRDIVTVKDLNTRSYEEISVISSVLWTQLQLLNNGVALGSVVIQDPQPGIPTPSQKELDKWELHYVLETCESYLASGRLPVSAATDEYLQESHQNAAEHSMWFDWSNLVYIATVVKSSFEESNPVFTTQDLLNVNPPQGPAEDAEDASRRHYELVPISHMRDALGFELHLFSDLTAGHLLAHLHHLGFFQRQDLHPMVYEEKFTNNNIICVFPIPLGLDLSNDVETLFAAIEGCLVDLDLSVNEQGFLLLVRKLWPNGMASEYALRRLTKHLISWIFAEDTNLATILRDYLAQGRQLPGVRIGVDSVAWPSAIASRPTPTSAVNNGGDYVASRRALLNQYVARWLLAFHDQNSSEYAKVLYEISTELADDASIDDSLFLGPRNIHNEKKRKTIYADSILRCIIKLCQTAVTFSVFDDLFLLWLETTSSMDLYREPMPSLFRLFNREIEGANRFSSLVDASFGPVDAVGTAVVDSWRLIMRVASADKEGWSRSLTWLCVFARSGVEIPVTTYKMFASLATEFSATLFECALLVEAAFISTWIKSMGRQELQIIFSALHSHLASQILESISSNVDVDDAVLFIRRSLATCLLLYGCERNSLVTLGMVTEDEIKDIPSRRKMNTRATMAADPVIIDASLMNALESYVQANVEDISCFVAKFLNTFVMDAALLEPYEVDNFILRNGRVLCACAWEFYEIQRPELSGIRISFMLRILVVDAQPFQTLMQEIFGPKGNWEGRFLAVVRLFRIILDVTSPSFHVEERQWRSSVIDVFYRYFSALWMDEKEEIRLAVYTWSQSLLPAHMEVISSCWNESLAKAPIAERVKLVSFLVQLHPHFPSWKVLSWDAIIETLLEDDYLQKHGENDDGAAAAHLSMYGLSSTDEEAAESLRDPEMAALRVSIIFLGLQMIADGASIDIFSILKIKFHLAQVLGFDNVSIVPASHGQAFHVRLDEFVELPEQSLPCITQLSMVFDAFHPFNLAPSAVGGLYVEDETLFPLLVGAIFVDVLLHTFIHVQDLAALPVLTVKSMLESLMIIIYKHDLDIKPLKHLYIVLVKAVRRALELVSLDISYEIRQLALSVVQAYVKRWPNLRGSFIVDAVESIAKLIIHLDHDGEDILVAQARSFLENTFIGFYANGIFGLLCRRTLERDFFVVLKHVTAKVTLGPSESLRDAFLRDAIQNVAEHEPKICQTMLNNINTYVEIVHHEHYTPDMMQVVGNALTNVARRSSDWPITFDVSPMLFVASTLLQHNKTHSRELLSYMDTILRVALTRFNVAVQPLSHILHVTSTLFRKIPMRAGAPAGQGQPNTIALAVFEVLAYGLRKEGRITPATIASTMEVIMFSDAPGYASPAQIFPDSFLSLAEDGLSFLQNHVWSEVHSENDFAASVAVAKAILHGAEQKPDIMIRYSDTSEKNSRQILNVRTWNILAFAALSSTSTIWTAFLFAHFSAFSFAYNSSLRSFGNPTNSPPETAQADINHAYNAVKLWLLLALKKFRLKGVSPARERDPVVLDDNEDAATRMVWNELWPSFAMLVTFFETESRAIEGAALAALTWSSVADLFLFVRQSRSDVAHEGSSHVAILNRLHRLSAEDAATSNRLNRALRSMAEPPLDVSMDVLISQISKSMIAEEKIIALEAKSREIPISKAAQDRNRRDMRVPT